MSGRSSLIMGTAYHSFEDHTIWNPNKSKHRKYHGSDTGHWGKWITLFHFFGGEPFTGQTFYPEHWSQNTEKSQGSYYTAFFNLLYSATVVLASSVRLSIWSTWWADTGSCMQNGQRWCFATGQLSWKFPNCWIHQNPWRAWNTQYITYTLQNRTLIWQIM